MEFFKVVNVQTNELEIQNQLALSNIESYSSLIFNLEEPSDNESYIGGLWGEFTLTFQKIKGGVRFTLQDCPNALCWTVTTGYPPKRESLVIHLTINRIQKQPEFVNEINEFLEDHSACLIALLK